jgi:hypothetical protein
MDRKTDFVAIKKGHVAWRGKLVEMFSGRKQLTSADVLDHHQCALGKWYDGDGTRHFQHLPDFQTLGVQHQSFHRLVSEMVQLWNNGKRSEALSRFEELMPLTNQLFKTLDQLSLEAAGAGVGGAAANSNGLEKRDRSEKTLASSSDLGGRGRQVRPGSKAAKLVS